MKLMSMVEFTKQQFKLNALKDSYVAYMAHTIQYANFLDQPVSAQMFVCVDTQGKLISEPKEYKNWRAKKRPASMEIGIACLKYHTAKLKVIFEGFNLVKNTDFHSGISVSIDGDWLEISVPLYSIIVNTGGEDPAPYQSIETLLHLDLTILPHYSKQFI